MSKKKSMGLKRFQWFKLTRPNSDLRSSQSSTLKKSKDLVNPGNQYNQKIQKSLNHLFQFQRTSEQIDEEKYQYKLHLLNLLESESEICDGNDSLFRVDLNLDDKVDVMLRDEAVRHLQIMNKVFFEMPLNILCSAIQLIDRFITRVKVRPKYMFCASAVCYQMVVKQYDIQMLHTEMMTDLPVLSRSGGTLSDMIRMEDIIRTKLFNELHTITIYDFVDAIINYLLINHDYSLVIMKLLQPIIETAITNYISAHQKPSILALSCIVLYNDYYPHQPICSPWTVFHLSSLLKHEWSTVYNYAHLIGKLHNNRFNRMDSNRHFLTGIYNKKPVNLYRFLKDKLDTIVEE